jgi:hypothetical protein
MTKWWLFFCMLAATILAGGCGKEPEGKEPYKAQTQKRIPPNPIPNKSSP